MALKAVVSPLKARLMGGLLIEGIKDNALFRIERSEFQHVARSHKTNGDSVIEIQRSRCAGCNPRRLEAGFGKHQNLRADRNAQLMQNRTEIAVLLFVLQLHLAVVY